MNEEIPKDESIIKLFNRFHGEELVVYTSSNKKYVVWNIAWGYDIGDEYAHITTNISTDIENESIDFFYTNEISKIFSAEKNYFVYENE